jgi:hypothetical protein
MTETDLRVLKLCMDKLVLIETVDGEQMTAKVISVFDEESDADMFYELISSSKPDLYPRKEQVCGYSLPLKDIVSVRAVE